MKVRMTFNFDDDDRELLARMVGKDGRADHATCRLAVGVALDGAMRAEVEQEDVHRIFDDEGES
jgi:hypothetical protein